MYLQPPRNMGRVFSGAGRRCFTNRAKYVLGYHTHVMLLIGSKSFEWSLVTRIRASRLVVFILWCHGLCLGHE